jgi:uncharacterized protein (TIGR02217 family)
MKKTPEFNTIDQTTAAFQGSISIALAQYPRWRFTLSIPQMQGRLDDSTSPIALITGLFLICKGKAGSFLIQDTSDYQVLAYTFGVGDGTSKTFQLTRPVGDAVDIVQNVNGLPVISVSGVPTTAFTLDSRGVCTFNVAPPAAAPLSWTGNFDFRVKFSSDTMQDLQEFFSDRWAISTLELISCIL